MTMGDAEEAYALVCEEQSETPRGHTQLWKYVQTLSVAGIVQTTVSGVGQRGKTTLISLPRVPAADLEQELVKTLSKGGESQWR
jgi:cell division control protein 6